MNSQNTLIVWNASAFKILNLESLFTGTDFINFRAYVDPHFIIGCIFKVESDSSILKLNSIGPQNFCTYNWLFVQGHNFTAGRTNLDMCTLCIESLRKNWLSRHSCVCAIIHGENNRNWEEQSRKLNLQNRPPWKLFRLLITLKRWFSRWCSYESYEMCIIFCCSFSHRKGREGSFKMRLRNACNSIVKCAPKCWPFNWNFDKSVRLVFFWIPYSHGKLTRRNVFLLN